MQKILLPLALAALFFSSCAEEVDNGGACYYDTDTIAARIVRMDSTGTPYPEIILTVTNANGDLDSIRYTNNTNESPTWEQCAERGFVMGAQLKCIHQVITSGSCNPEIFTVKKELHK